MGPKARAQNVSDASPEGQPTESQAILYPPIPPSHTHGRRCWGYGRVKQSRKTPTISRVWRVHAAVRGRESRSDRKEGLFQMQATGTHQPMVQQKEANPRKCQNRSCTWNL